jgi:hypothetical protein
MLRKRCAQGRRRERIAPRLVLRVPREAGAMTCPTCKGTGVERVPLFTTIEEVPCRRCGGVQSAPEAPRVRFACGGTASVEDQWLGGLLRCTLGHWHTRFDYFQAKAA